MVKFEHGKGKTRQKTPQIHRRRLYKHNQMGGLGSQ